MSRACALLLIVCVRGYQRLISPLFFMLGARCRFYPSCSQYAAEALARYGALGGSWRSAKRLCRCHPYSPGGYDPVEQSDG